LNNSQKKVEASRLKVQAIDEAKLGNYMSASFHMASALKLFGEAGDKHGITESKKLLIEYNRKAEEQMQDHEFSVELDDKTRNALQEVLESLTKSKKLGENLELIAKSYALVPSLKVAQKNAKEIVPVTAQLVTHYGIGDEGHLASLDNYEESWFAENYNFGMNMSRMLLNSIFSKLILNKQFNEKNIMGIVASKEIFNGEYLLKLKIGLERRFAGDYFSSLHILVPLFEKTFMSLSGLVGLDNIAYNGKTISTRNTMLSSDILMSKEYQAMWGEDFCYMLNFFLLDAGGYRFRHKIAHGDITVSECNFTSFNLMIFFILKALLMIKVEPKK